MIPLPPKVKLYVGIILAGLLAAGGYWEKAAAGAVPAWLPPILAALLFAEGLMTVPPAAKKTITDLTSKLADMSGVLLLAGALIFATTSCKGATFPSLDKVEQVVLGDLAECGTAPTCVTKMETDVADLIAQGLIGPEAGTDAVVLVKDTLQLLIDAGLIPQSVLPKARAVFAETKLTLAKRVQESPADAGGQ